MLARVSACMYVRVQVYPISHMYIRRFLHTVLEGGEKTHFCEKLSFGMTTENLLAVILIFEQGAPLARANSCTIMCRKCTREILFYQNLIDPQPQSCHK